MIQLFQHRLPAFQVLLFLFLFPLAEAGAKIVYVGPEEEYGNIMYGLTQVDDGDTVIVRDGVYVEDVKVREGVVLMAENRHGAVIGDGSDTRAMISIRQNPVDGAVIDGFKFLAGDLPAIRVGDMDASKAPVNCVIKNNLIEGRKVGIDISMHTSNTTISGNTITGCSGPGIMLSGVGDNEITGNTIEDCDMWGIFLGEREEMNLIGPTIVRGNTIRNNKAGGIGIERWKATVERNLIEGNLTGVGTSSAAHALVIRDSNQVINNTEAGIDIESNSQASIEDNLISGNGYEGINSRGKTTIRRNRIELNQGCGISVPSGSVHIEENVITSNESHGIQTRPESESAMIISNTISGNLEIGIIITSVSADAKDNLITDNERHGIEVGPEAGEVKIRNNRIEENHFEGIRANRKALIQGNLIHANGSHGIYLAETCQDAEITGRNTVSNNLGYEIFVTEGSSALIKYNTLEDDTTKMDFRENNSGIAIEGSAHIEGNLIQHMNTSGIYITDMADEVVIRNINTIQECREGILVLAPALIRGNILTNNKDEGIWIGQPAQDVIVTGNMISGNQRGISYQQFIPNLTIDNNNISENNSGVVARGEALLRSNTIRGNSKYGVLILGEGIDLGDEAEADSGMNAILENGEWNVRNKTPDTVSAWYNFWGLTDSDSIDATIWDNDEDSLAGPVIFEPFLGDLNVGIDGTVIQDTMPGIINYLEVFPNPFQHETSICFSLREANDVYVKVIDLSGRLVSRVIWGEHFPPGEHRVLWNGSARYGLLIPAGLYSVVLQAGREARVRKVLLIR